MMRTALKLAVRTGLELSPWQRRLMWRVPRGDRGVALTFDDGPDPVQTPRILDLLAEHRATATFFVLGEAVEQHPALLRRIVAEGHSIGNHTYSHTPCDHLSWKDLRDELRETDRAVTAALQTGPTAEIRRLELFRPPFGILPAEHALRLLGERRMVLWNRDSRDYRGASAERITSLAEELRPRDVILLHDRFPATLQALPSLIQRARDRGLEWTHLRESQPRRAPLFPGLGRRTSSSISL